MSGAVLVLEAIAAAMLAVIIANMVVGFIKGR